MPKRIKFNLADLPPAPDLTFETELWQRGHHLLAGIDEAGRGALAGPVFAAAVILPSTRLDLLPALEGVNDSKKLTPAQRSHWATQIPRVAVAWAVASASAAEIDQIGILPATHLAALRASGSRSQQLQRLQRVEFLARRQVRHFRRWVVRHLHGNRSRTSVGRGDR